MPTSTLQWLINNGASTAFGTGPNVDHTFGTPLGRYIYFRRGDILDYEIAQIKSFIFDETNDVNGGSSLCFEFWYHMYGETVPQLNILKELDVSKDEIRMWSLRGSQGDEWRRALVPLSSNERFSIIVQAYASRGELR